MIVNGVMSVILIPLIADSADYAPCAVPGTDTAVRRSTGHATCYLLFP